MLRRVERERPPSPIISEEMIYNQTYQTYVYSAELAVSGSDLITRANVESLDYNIPFVEMTVQRGFQQLGIDATDQIILSISSEAENGRTVSMITPPNTYASDVDGQKVWDLLALKLNSAESFKSQISITIIRKTNQPLYGFYAQGPSYISFQTFQLKSQSGVVIHPDDDTVTDRNNCFSQAVAIGLAYHEKIPNVSRGLFEKMTLTRYGNRYVLRQQYATWVEEMCGSALKIQSTTEMNLVETTFDVTLVIYNERLQRVYPKEILVTNTKPIIALWYLTEQRHMHYIKNVGKFMRNELSHSTVHFCTYCLGTFTKKIYCAIPKCGSSCNVCHICFDQCKSCHSRECTYDATYSNHWCENRLCGEVFRNAECAKRHVCLADSIKRCNKCEKRQHSNECFKSFCNRCYEVFDNGTNHQCALRQTNLKEPSRKYIAYDFECVFSETMEHVPKLVAAMFVYETPVWASRFDHCKRDGVYIFTDMELFTDFILAANDGYSFIAHNARSYDHILIKKLLAKRKIRTTDLSTGRKIIEMVIKKSEKGRKEKVQTRFIDSMSYVQGSLAAIGKDFGCAVAKGYFPYDRITLEQFDEHAKIPFPRVEDYLANMRLSAKEKTKQKQLEEFYGWYNEQPTDALFDVVEEYIKYNILDVKLLAECIARFKKSCADLFAMIPLKDGVERTEVDVFQYPTLSSCTMKVFCKWVLDPEAILPIDRHHIMLKAHLREQVQHVKSETLHSVHIDARVGNVVYILLDCYRSGCVKHHAGKLLRRTGKRAIRQHDQYLIITAERQLLEKEGYHVHWIWSCETNENTNVMDIRDSYRGGIVSVFNRHVKNQRVVMADFVSQYPTVMSGTSYDPLTNNPIEWYLPKGKAVHSYDTAPCLEKEGVAKVRILPPKQCYAPHLFYKVKYQGDAAPKNMLGLCRVCMETRQMESCTHTDVERAFEITTTYPELRYAVTLGYQILKTFEKYEYDEKSHTLFKSFIDVFYVQKSLSKRAGIVEGETLTAKGKALVEELHERCGVMYTANDFKDAPVQRLVAKLIMNGFSGKFGQREDLRSSHCFFVDVPSDMVAFRDLLYDTSLTFDSIHMIAGAIIAVTHPISGATRGYLGKNDIIIAYVTAHARVMLLKVANALQHRVLYTDTDSIYFKYEDGIPFHTGNRLGDLELEMGADEKCNEFVGCGRKQYVLGFEDGHFEAKIKGISLHSENIASFTPQCMLELIRKGPKQSQILTATRQFKTEGYGEMIRKKTVYSQKKISFVGENRKPYFVNGVYKGTLPFGWVH